MLQPPNRMNPPSRGAARVMLIDDDGEFVEKLRYMVESEGFDCCAFTDPGEAVQSLGAGHFDFVVTDLQMPGINGIQVIDAVKRLSPESVVIVVSGCLDQHAGRNVLRHGADLCLSKPLHLSALLDALQNVAPDKAKGARRGS